LGKAAKVQQPQVQMVQMENLRNSELLLSAVAVAVPLGHPPALTELMPQQDCQRFLRMVAAVAHRIPMDQVEQAQQMAVTVLITQVAVAEVLVKMAQTPPVLPAVVTAVLAQVHHSQVRLISMALVEAAVLGTQ